MNQRHQNKILLLFSILVYYSSAKVWNWNSSSGLYHGYDSLNIKYDFLHDQGITLNQNITFDPSSLFGRNDVIPGRGVAYVKIFKTGSTTVATTLHRIAAKYKLNCPKMPRSRTFNFSHPSSLDEVKKLEGLTGNFPFDMYVNHCVYGEFLFETVPGAKHQYVATVRDPASRVESAWNNGKAAIASATKKSHALNCRSLETCAFLAKERPEVLHEFITKWVGDWTMILWELQSYQLTGLYTYDHSFKRHYQRLIEDVVSGRVILMVTERIAESLVILRHAYGLSLDDVAYYSQRVRGKTNNSGENTDALEVLRELQPYDLFLHKLANAALDRWITTSLDNIPFEEEVAKIVKQSEYYSSNCWLNPKQKHYRRERRRDCVFSGWIYGNDDGGH